MDYRPPPKWRIRGRDYRAVSAAQAALDAAKKTGLTGPVVVRLAGTRHDQAFTIVKNDVYGYVAEREPTPLAKP